MLWILSTICSGVLSWAIDKNKKLFYLFILNLSLQTISTISFYFLSKNPPIILKKYVISPGFWTAFGDSYNYFTSSQQVLSGNFEKLTSHSSSALLIWINSKVIENTSYPELNSLLFISSLILFLCPISFYFLREIYNYSVAIKSAKLLCLIPSFHIYGSQLLREPYIYIVLTICIGSIGILSTRKLQNFRKQMLCSVIYSCNIVLSASFLSEIREWLIWAIALSTFGMFLFTKNNKKTLGISFLVILGILIGQHKPTIRLFQLFSEQEINFTIKNTKSNLSNLVFVQKENNLKIKNILKLIPLRITEKLQDAKNFSNLKFYLITIIDFILIFAFMQNSTNNLSHKKIYFAYFQYICMISCSSMFLLVIGFSDSLGNTPRYLSSIYIPLVYFISSFWKEN